MIKHYQEKIFRRLSRYKKALIFSIRKPFRDTLPVFIMGCGRSGTTMMINIFHRDHRVESLDENNPKIAENFMLVPERIPQTISASKAPVLVMKPILNSFEALDLLKTYNNSRVVWILRDYKDMVASSTKKFGTVVSDYMKNLVLYNKRNNWLSLGVPANTREILSTIDSSDFTSSDWMALVWWSVNRTIILDRLSDSDRFLLVHYEALVRNPDSLLKVVYQFIGLKYHYKAAEYIHPTSVGKGAAIQLQSQVKKMCDNLVESLPRISGTVMPQR